MSIMSNENFDKIILIYGEKLQYNELLIIMFLVIARRFDLILSINFLIRLAQTENPFRPLEYYCPYSVQKNLASYIYLVLSNC